MSWRYAFGGSDGAMSPSACEYLFGIYSREDVFFNWGIPQATFDTAAPVPYPPGVAG